MPSQVRSRCGAGGTGADDDDISVDGRRGRTIESVSCRVRAQPVRGGRHGISWRSRDLVKNFTKSLCTSLRLPGTPRRLGPKDTSAGPDLNYARKNPAHLDITDVA